MAWWSIVFFAVFLIGVTKSGFGSGVGLMIVPMVAISLGHIPGRRSEMALGLLLPLLIVGDLVAVWQYFRLFTAETPVRKIIGRLAPGTAVGVIVGGYILWAVHKQANLVGALIRIEIGVESLLLVGLHWWRMWRGVQHHLMPEPARSNVTGGFAAISSTLAHAAGPIVAMYLLPLKLDRQLYVGVSALYFFFLNTAKLPAYYFSGQFDHTEFSFTLRFLPLVLAGALFGRWLNRRLNDKVFINVVYFVTFCLGWYILIDGIKSLMSSRAA
jgi:hypothetical protein